MSSLLQCFRAQGARYKRRLDLKKQTTKTKKLVLQKETLTSLKDVAGGYYLWNTVYYPAPTEYRCVTHGCGYA